MVSHILQHLADRLRESTPSTQSTPTGTEKDVESLRTIIDANRDADDYHIVDVWEHPSGLPCIIIQTSLGHYNGYVGTDIDNPVDYESGLDWDDDELVSVHGGVTWGPDDEGWVGFDTAHAYDIPLTEDGYVIATTNTMMLLPMPRGEARAKYDTGDKTEYTPDDLAALTNRMSLSRYHHWTPEAVKKETNVFAAQLAIVDNPQYRIHVRASQDGTTVTIEDRMDGFLPEDENQ